MSKDEDSLESFVKNMYDHKEKDLVLTITIPDSYGKAETIKKDNEVADLMSNIESLRTYPKFSMNKTSNGILRASIVYDSMEVAYADIFSLNNALSKISTALEKNSYETVG